MKYAMSLPDGRIEIREDSSPLQSGAVELTDAEFEGLRCGSMILQNGKIITNKNWSPA